jgi:hypothetical protein
MKPRAAAIPLDPSHVAAWRLTRQRIDPRAPAGDLEQVATDLIGVQAQVTSAAGLSFALRVANGNVGDAARAQAERRLIRSWGMRGTLHLWAADDYPLIAAALGRRETWRRPVWFRYFGVTEAEMEALIEAIGEILGDGRPRTRSELGAEIGERLGPKHVENLGSSWGTYLKPAAMRGLLSQAAGEGSSVTFTRPAVWLGRWRAVDPGEALEMLVRRYLAAYGPAAVAEITRWWGGSRTDIRKATVALGAVEVEVAGERGLVLPADVDVINATQPIRGPRLLGSFDPLTVGSGVRAWFLPKAIEKRVSRTAGWISPIVLLDGVVVGVWTTARRGSRLLVTIDLFNETSAATRRGLEREAARVSTILDAELDLVYGPAFDTEP